jgi:hypothetical protein
VRNEIQKRDDALHPEIRIQKCRNAKAELTRRSQACEVLTDTGIRVAKMR